MMRQPYELLYTESVLMMARFCIVQDGIVYVHFIFIVELGEKKKGYIVQFDELP